MQTNAVLVTGTTWDFAHAVRLKRRMCHMAILLSSCLGKVVHNVLHEFSRICNEINNTLLELFLLVILQVLHAYVFIFGKTWRFAMRWSGCLRGTSFCEYIITVAMIASSFSFSLASKFVFTAPRKSCSQAMLAASDDVCPSHVGDIGRNVCPCLLRQRSHCFLRVLNIMQRHILYPSHTSDFGQWMCSNCIFCFWRFAATFLPLSTFLFAFSHEKPW